MASSSDAARLYRRLAEHPDGAWALEELARELHLSKTRVRRLLGELDEEGAIGVTTTDD